MSPSELSARLHAAREYVGLTISDVSASSGIPEDDLVSIEAGITEIDELGLQRLAATYGVRTSYLTEPEDPLLAGAVTVLGRLAGELQGHDRAEALRFAAYLRHASGD